MRLLLLTLCFSTGLATAEPIGQPPMAMSFRTSHNGGERWPARSGSVEYQTILEWIRGSRQ